MMIITSTTFCTVAIAAVLVTIGPIAADGNSAHRVSFWSDIDFHGEEYHLRMEPRTCYKLGVANDRLSSMSTYGACVDLYTRDDCSGGMFRMESNRSQCHRNLGDCDMNDRVSSMRLCPRCRNSCYYEDGRQLDNERYDRDGAEECQCHCNCAGACGGSPDVYK